jgi:hypothetical protein
MATDTPQLIENGDLQSNLAPVQTAHSSKPASISLLESGYDEESKSVVSLSADVLDQFMLRHNRMQAAALIQAVDLYWVKKNRAYVAAGFSNIGDYAQHHLGYNPSKCSRALKVAEMIDSTLETVGHSIESVTDGSAEWDTLRRVQMTKLYDLSQMGEEDARRVILGESIPLPDGSEVSLDNINETPRTQLKQAREAQRALAEEIEKKKERIAVLEEKLKLAEAEGKENAGAAEELRRLKARTIKEDNLHSEIQIRIDEATRLTHEIRKVIGNLPDPENVPKGMEEEVARILVRLRRVVEGSYWKYIDLVEANESAVDPIGEMRMSAEMDRAADEITLVHMDEEGDI